MFKRSVHIGLNEYNQDYYGNINPLNACVQDAKDMRNVFQTKFDFEPILILDKQATYAHVVDVLTKEISSSGPGDLLVITFSGHGTQLPDSSGEEIDGYDEAYCLYDGILFDDHIKHMLNQAIPGLNVVILSDSCHSGTMAKFRMPEGPDGNPGTPKFFPGFKLKYNFMNLFRRAKTKENINIITIGGCEDKQYSYDGQTNSAFTESFLKSLDPKLSYEKLFKQIKKNMSNTLQTPTMETYGKDVSDLVSSKIFQ